MTDFSNAITLEDIDTGVTDNPSMFYVVSQRKLVVLYILTLGMYGVYWFYQNWARYNRNAPTAQRAGNAIWALPRALFSVFFVHDLFAKVKAHGILNNEVGVWSTKPHATMMVMLLLVSNMLDRAANKDLGSPITDVLSLLILFPLAHQFALAQNMVNISCGDPHAEGNKKFTGANYAWIIFGSLAWLLILWTMLLA
jgi:hypothetical protein